jgi:hypothetical protein
MLLSSPLVYLFLLHVAALLLASFWPGKSTPRGRADGFPGPTAGRDLLPVRELAASCSAEYSARFAQAIKRIRMR